MAKLHEEVFFFDANCDSAKLLKRLREEQGLVCLGRIEQFGEPQPGQLATKAQRHQEFYFFFFVALWLCGISFLEYYTD